MSASVAIAASAVAISASNSAQISAQHRENCKLYIEGFDSKGAGVESQKHYAECVQLLNPNPAPESLVYFFKGCILTIFLFAIIGGIKGWKERWGFWDQVSDCACYAFLWACVAFITLVVLFFVILGIGYVLVG